VAILPGGTGNILAHNLGIPQDLAQAVQVGLRGTRRLIDTGSVNGEHFVVMAGAGLDALMMRDADGALKDRIGPAAYLLSGAGNMGAPRVIASIVADGRPFFRGEISMVLVGNVGKTLGGIMVFKDAEPDDGILELGVVTANNALDWARTMSRVAMGSPEESSFVEVTRGRRFEVRFADPFLYEVDGNPRRVVKRLRIAVHPGSITLCVPSPTLDEALATQQPRTDSGVKGT
jgi:diacylglycerol kinase (ATP)